MEWKGGKRWFSGLDVGSVAARWAFSREQSMRITIPLIVTPPACSIAHDRAGVCKVCTSPNPTYDPMAQVSVLTVSTVKNVVFSLFATLESQT